MGPQEGEWSPRGDITGGLEFVCLFLFKFYFQIIEDLMQFLKQIEK